MRRSRRTASARRSRPRSATTTSTTSTHPFAGSTGHIHRRRTVLRWSTPSSRAWTRLFRRSAILLLSEAQIMAIPITVPRLGWNMEQGVFVGWLKADGAAVRAGEALFTLESDKATEDVEVLDDGVLHIPANGPRKGDVVAVGAVIGFVLQPGEPVDCGLEGAAHAVSGLMAPLTACAAPSNPQSAVVPPASSPRARRTAAKLGIDWQA